MDIITHLRDQQLKRDAEKIRKQFEQLGGDLGEAFAGDILQKAPQIQKAFHKTAKAADTLAKSEEDLNKLREHSKTLAKEIKEGEERLAAARQRKTNDVTLKAEIAERNLAKAAEYYETSLARVIRLEHEERAALDDVTKSSEEQMAVMQELHDARDAEHRQRTALLTAQKNASAASHDEADVMNYRITQERKLETLRQQQINTTRQLTNWSREHEERQHALVESLYDTVEAEKKLDDAAQTRADNDKKRAAARASQDDTAAIRKRIALERDEYRAHAENARRNAKEEELRNKATQRGGIRGFANEAQRVIGSIVGVRLQGKAGLALMAAAADAIYETVQITGAAAQSIALLPALAATAGAGIGTLALATAGFGDTVKELGPGGDLEKFAQGIQNLSPAAQQAALSIQQIFPELTKLQQAVQEQFFQGLGGEIETLSAKYLPSVQGMTTGIAQSFNALLKGLGADLMQPGTFTQIQGIFNDIGDTIRNLTPAVRDFVQAFLDITSAGTSLLPGLATDLAGVAREFANFIREARDSGKLREFMQDGIDAVKALWNLLSDLANGLKTLFNLDDAKANIADFQLRLEMTESVIALLTGNWDAYEQHVKVIFDNMKLPVRNFYKDLVAATHEAVNKMIEAFNFGAGMIQKALMSPLDIFIKGWNKMADTVAGRGAGMEHIDWSPQPLQINERLPVDYGPAAPPARPGVREGYYRDRAGVEHPLPGRGTNPDFAAGGPYGVPAAPPGPGQDKTPPLNIPREQFGLESIPLGQFPGAGWDAGSVDFGPLGPPGKPPCPGPNCDCD